MTSFESSIRSDASIFSSFTDSSADSVPSTFNFVIAGGSFAAIQAVKIVCKYVIPKAVSKNPEFKACITVVAPNKESYWNVAAVRLIANPEIMDSLADQIFFPLEETMRRYLSHINTSTLGNQPKVKHELHVIQGKVLSVDSELNMLTYLKLTDEGNPEHGDDFFGHTIAFNKLILATGASSSSPAFKLNGSSELTKQALRDFQKSARDASSICIVGAGGAGVELAGELGYKYGRSKKITLYSAFEGTLERLKPKIADDAIPKLRSLGVETITRSRAVSASVERSLSDLTDPNMSSLNETHSEDLNSPTSPKSPSMPFPSEIGQNINHYDTIFSKHSLNSLQKSFNLRTPYSYDHSVHNLISKVKSHLSPRSSISSVNEAAAQNAAGTNKNKKKRTVVTFENGYKEAFDCYIPTTGNVANSSYLSYSCLDSNGYVVTDPYLRMARNNKYNNIYVYGDLVSGGNQNISDICEEQSQTLKMTLLHDIIGPEHHPLKRYKPSKVTYYVPISRKDGIGQTMYGLPIPGFVVSLVKGKTFRVPKSKRYLNAPI